MYLLPENLIKELDFISSQIKYVRDNVPYLELPSIMDPVLTTLELTETNIKNKDLSTAITDLLPALAYVHAISSSWVSKFTFTDSWKRPTGTLYTKPQYRKDASMVKDILKALHEISSTLITLAYWYI